jgi:hypothetical protein
MSSICPHSQCVCTSGYAYSTKEEAVYQQYTVPVPAALLTYCERIE